MYDFLREALFRLLLEKAEPKVVGRFGSMIRAAMVRTVFALTAAWIVGATIGWYGHAASASAAEPQKACREEVISVDGARGGPVSCTHAEHTGELKDGYLVCKCKKK